MLSNGYDGFDYTFELYWYTLIESYNFIMKIKFVV